MAEGRPKMLVANRGFAHYAEALGAAILKANEPRGSRHSRRSDARNSIGNPVPGGCKRERERMLRKIAAGQVKVDE